MPQEHTLYLDIETLPGDPDCLDWKVFEARSNIKDAEKIEADIAEKKAKALANTSFDGGWGSVCVIGWAVDDDKVKTWRRPDLERGLIQEAIDSICYDIRGDLPRVTICGHNVAFDLAFLKKRCIIHGIELPRWWPRNPKPWDGKIRDTMKLWDDRYGEYTSLDELCRILGIEGKGDFDGSMVAEAWANGEYQKVAEYCADDVERVRKINKRILAVGL
jgi:3'-5' exonuclease